MLAGSISHTTYKRQMKTKIFCGQCGTENPRENNFCLKCGHKLVHAMDSLTVTETKPATSSDYFDIKGTLQRLIRTSGFSIISIGDYYVQFSNDLIKRQLCYEAVSSFFLPSVGNKDKEFKELGFTHDPSGNYYKFISHADFSADQTAQEIKTIFETIYKINFSSYKIENDFEDAPIAQTFQAKQTTATTSYQNQNKNYVFLAIIIIAVIIGICAMSGDSKEAGSDKTEIVSNSAFDASVYQVECYLKREYLKDPDSYEGIEWSKVQKDNSNSLYKYYVRHKYRAKNSFGGYVVEEKIFYLDQSGNVVRVIDF
jgi:uncharacterized membrane protein YkgB